MSCQMFFLGGLKDKWKPCNVFEDPNIPVQCKNRLVEQDSFMLKSSTKGDAKLLPFSPLA